MGWHSSPLAFFGSENPQKLARAVPDTEDGEVEIARISISSTTGDVTSVYAKPVNGAIRYRVVDEYEGDTLTETTEMESDRPLTLGELADFFLNAWSLVDVLAMNYEDDLDGRLEFFVADRTSMPSWINSAASE